MVKPIRAQSANHGIKIVFMGTPDLCISTLDALYSLSSKGVKISAVVTREDKPVGRTQEIAPPAVKVWAQKYTIPVLQPATIKNEEALGAIRGLTPDVIIVFAYGQIIPKAILDIPAHGALNIHPSLLPKYRGASPLQYAILSGEKETGITLIQMDEKMDHGPIVFQKSFPLDEKETYATLYEQVKTKSAELVKEVIFDWVAEKITPIPQDDIAATYTKILTKEDGHIMWDQSAIEVERQIRAFSPWPGTFTEWEEKAGERIMLKIHRASTLPQNTSLNLSYGQVFITDKNELGVGTADGILVIDEIQPASKPIMKGNEFIQGYPRIVGAILI